VYIVRPDRKVIDNVTMGAIRAQGVTMLIVTHQMGFARDVADRLSPAARHTVRR
jgi:ABC-type polar amino acid transport system ATPase subunit